MFFYIVLIIVLMAATSVFIMKTTFWMVSRLGHGFIEETHKSAEFIINTGKLPPFWYKKKISLPPLLDKYRCMKKMKKIISYFEKSQIAGDEYSRSVIAGKLTEIYNEWTDLDWDKDRPLP